MDCFHSGRLSGCRRHFAVVRAVTVLFAILAVTPAIAAPQTCSSGLASHAVFPNFSGPGGARAIVDLRTQLGERVGSAAWGLDENVTVDLDRRRNVPVLTVRLPKGSINPKNLLAPLGGMGWRWRPVGMRRVARACLRYRVRFSPEFRFRLGGKLPGLFGGTGPAGGRATTGMRGFSLRLMWRRDGASEVYAYIPGHPKGRGTSLRRGAWWFSSGQWMDVAEEVVLNDPDVPNGRVRVWIDGTVRLDVADLLIRRTPELGITGVMGDVFYGGKSPRWAAPRDAHIQFSAFELFW